MLRDMVSDDLAARSGEATEDLRRARGRLENLATAPARGLTAPDSPSGEQWDAGQVWAHLAEFGGYWRAELRRIVDARSADPVPFGRTKADPHRVAMIEAHRHQPVAEHVTTVLEDIDLMAAELAKLSPLDWTRVGRHETLGVMDLWQFLDRFVTGHYHEHADQLDELRAAGP
jgi:DinB superfamily